MTVTLSTIAIGENDSAQAAALQRAVESLGYRCAGVASKASDALTLVKDLRPQVILLDSLLPGSDGLKAAEQLALLHSTAIILMLPGSAPTTVAGAIAIGAGGFLHKPFAVDQLSLTIESTWRQFQMIQLLLDKNRDLSAALEARKLIEKAKGILMEQQGLSEESAYKLLQRMSQDQAAPIKDVCQSVIQVRLALRRIGSKKTSQSHIRH